MAFVSGAQAERQLDLLGARAWPAERRLGAAHVLADALSDAVGERVHLVVHDNSSTMVSFRRSRGLVHCRLHHMFLDAPKGVLQAIATFLGPPHATRMRREAASEAIDAYVRTHRSRIAAPRLQRVEPRGRVHDLQAIFDRLNAEHFGGAIRARIGWGANRSVRRQRTLKTGVYVHDARLIRIHPVLDRPEVPELYVAAVIHHEMLHQAVPAQERKGRRIVHGPEFKSRERAYPDHARARAWERANLSLLLAQGRG